MSHKFHPIAKITKVSGMSGEVRLKPLSRYFEEYIESRSLSIGFDKDLNQSIKLERVIKSGKSKRCAFEGIKDRDDAEKLVGQIIFAERKTGDKADWVSSELIGFTVVTESGQIVGDLADILWLPANDVYVIRDGKKEILIPVIEEIVQAIEFQLGLIIILPMEGLL